jgi:hypothetical protein
MPALALRFGVFDGAGFRSATWKCWTPSGKEDVYLSCREMGGTLKASLHESGAWHVAFENKFFHQKVRQEDKNEKGRFLDKWCAPPPIAPGVRLAFRIVTPRSSVCTPYKEAHAIVQVPKPVEGKAIEFGVLIVDPTTQVSNWPGKNKMCTSLVGSYTLPSERTVWVVYREIPIPVLPRQTGRVTFFSGMKPEDLKGQRLKALVFGDEPDGSRVIYDCLVMHEEHVT